MHGFTDGCMGCRDLASGKQRRGSFLAPHNSACRNRMEEAIRAADPHRWERYLLRRRQEESTTEEVPRRETPGAQEESSGAGAGHPPASNAEVDHEAEDLFRDLDDEGPPEAGSGSGRSPGAQPDPGAVDGEPGEVSCLVERLCRVDNV